MVKIEVSRGLDLPIRGAIEDLQVKDLEGLEGCGTMGIDVSSFSQVHFRLLKKEGDKVLRGEAVVEDKGLPGRVWASPCSGVVSGVTRGLKRRLLRIDIQQDGDERIEWPKIPHEPQALITRLVEGGVMPFIRRRPFDLLADPTHLPRDVFVNACNTNPYGVSPNIALQGHEELFQKGLEVLATCTHGTVHLVSRQPHDAFSKFSHVQHHVASGPHPSGTHSVHIENISPIRSHDEVVWTLDVVGVIMIGALIAQGIYHTDRVVALCGEGFLAPRRGLYRTHQGVKVSDLLQNRLGKADVRLVSGDVLTGSEVPNDGVLGFYDTTLCAIPRPVQQEFLHFLGLGWNKYTASGTYASSLRRTQFSMTTNNHGEARPFVTGTPYDEVMPLKIHTMLLVKAVMAQDYDLAEDLGLLSVAPEDFALPSFVCPCKIEMIDIMRRGIDRYVAEL